MNGKVITEEIINDFEKYLVIEEKSKATIEKYIRDVRKFACFADNQPITKEIVMAFKSDLIEHDFAIRSINSMLASVNSLLAFLGMDCCRVKNIRSQQKVYCDMDQELTKNDYYKLLKAAEDNPRLGMILQTICGTGIRISELSYFTVEAVKKGEITVSCKNKTRIILVPGKLRKMLLTFSKKNGIGKGIIFRTKNGKALDRSNIWREMKKLCGKAGVKMTKVFPHNLRKLFAKTFYNVEKDIAKLADILGHSSIDTTRIYIMTSGIEHMKKIERLGLVVGDEELGVVWT